MLNIRKATIYAKLTNISVSVGSKRNSKWHPVSSMENPCGFGAHFAMEIHPSNQSGNQVTHRMFMNVPPMAEILHHLYLSLRCIKQKNEVNQNNLHPNWFLDSLHSTMILGGSEYFWVDRVLCLKKLLNHCLHQSFILSAASDAYL